MFSSLSNVDTHCPRLTALRINPRSMLTPSLDETISLLSSILRIASRFRTTQHITMMNVESELIKGDLIDPSPAL